MSDRLTFPRRKGIRRLKELPVLPTLFTAGNLGCGVTAIMCAANGEHLLTGCILIFVAMFCDMLDGKMARMTGTDGEFGAELDSIADVVSFGVAPALLVHRMVLGDNPQWIEAEGVWFITILYPILTAIRLARYNVEHSVEQTDYFKGLPSPGAAAVLCAWVLSYEYMQFADDSVYEIVFKRAILGIMVFVSLLMVSNIRFPHIGNTLLAGRIGFRRFLLIFVLLYLLVYEARLHSLAVLTTGYVLYGFIPGLIHGFRAWRRGRSLLDDDDDDDSQVLDALEDAGDDQQRA